MNKNYLYDIEFLQNLALEKNIIKYAKVSMLNSKEQVLEEITGRITDGSINVDGASAVRRTCSLTLVTQEIDCNNISWVLNSKFNLQIGIKNNINNQYPDIVWFPQGIYLLTSYSLSISASSVSISLSGKDKMALLNGEIAGLFEQTTVLDSIEEELEKGIYTKRQYEIDKIIYDMLYLLGNELSHNIIIKDLDKYGLKLVKYIGEGNSYVRQAVKDNYRVENDYSYQTSLITDNLKICEDWVEGTDVNGVDFINFNINNDYIFSSINNATGVENQTLFRSGQPNEYEYFLLYKLSYGDIAGYQATPLVYGNDLIANPGDTITSILDKIVSKLGGSYEYFYNLDGQFIFQKKQDYIDTSWSSFSYFLDNDITIVSQASPEFLYNFTNKNLFTSLSINPAINNIKNDFIVYGQTKTGYPLHLRYAIDKKPESYISLQTDSNGNHYEYYTKLPQDKVNDLVGPNKFPETNGIKPGSTADPQTTKNNYSTVYWNKHYTKQMVYRFGKQVFFSMSENNYNKEKISIEGNNQQGLQAGSYVILSRNTNRDSGDRYYIEKVENTLLGRKRIYISDPNKSIMAGQHFIWGSWEKITEPSTIQIINEPIVLQEEEEKIEEEYNLINVVDWRELIYQMALDFHKFGQEDNYLYNLQRLNPNLCKNGKTGYEQYYTDLMGFWPDIYRYKEYKENNTYVIKTGWNQEKLADPNVLFYWLDFIEGGNYLDNISVFNVGHRPLVKKENSVSILFEKEILPLMFYTGDSIPRTTLTYYPQKLTPEESKAFSISSYPTAAKTIMDTLINTQTLANRSISVNMLPLFFLDVNRKIKISSEDRNLMGQFLINKLTIPLSYNGTMSVSLSEVNDNIY